MVVKARCKLGLFLWESNMLYFFELTHACAVEATFLKISIALDVAKCKHRAPQACVTSLNE
jgi:hypothetical protein